MDDPVLLSRIQFGLTASFHFLFVPLTLGLSFLLAIMESVYVMTEKEIYRVMAKFWAKPFALAFAMGVATGIPLEFQFGGNWAHVAYYAGDIFGLPLALEGLAAFFLESTLVGLMLFGWRRLSPAAHLGVTWLVALGGSLSALFILIANGFMQYPAGAVFNPATLRLELASLGDLVFNPVAQVKFVHTVASGYVTGSTFVLAVSSFYLLRGRHLGLAKRSFAVASGFGFLSVLSVIFLGDESGYGVGEVQKMKLAAIEAEWETQPPPAGFTLFGFPNQELRRTQKEVKIPWALGIIATRSLDEPIRGLNDFLAENEEKVRLGMDAYIRLQQMQAQDRSHQTLSEFEALKPYLGYGFLLKKYVPDIAQASEEDIRRAALDTIPRVAPLFWTFRIMVAAGLVMLVVFAWALWKCVTKAFAQDRLLLRLAVFCLPLPWAASLCGWFVSEYGRQPWLIAEVLPTSVASSLLSVQEARLTLLAFGVLYFILFVFWVRLMAKVLGQGAEEEPNSLLKGDDV